MATDKRNVAILVGSLRKASLNRLAARALSELAPQKLHLETVEMGQLPLFDQDLEDGDSPPAWEAFRDKIRAADAVLFVTPEYNRSVPGGLKNAIDVGSRPYGKSVWNGKPAGVVSVSISPVGGFGANHHLRQMLACLNMPCMQLPEAYIGQAATLFGADGRLADDRTRELFRAFMKAYADWIETIVH